ncbi:hypothetical protein DL98DRAFT_539907 [Cadophora sp. DSE1049]|nr:hypothetical protein DL98DRAFT_539907 [Cadophora sp. DSE1049]
MDVRIIHEDWKLHLQGRIALHREPSLPIQLPQPTYMQLKELQRMALSAHLPEPQPSTGSSSRGSGNLLYKQLTSFRFGTDAAISELLKVCNAEAEWAEKAKESATAREWNASTSSGDNNYCTQALQEIEEVGALSWPAMVPEDYIRELSQTLPNAGLLENEGSGDSGLLQSSTGALESGFWWLHKFGRLGISVIAIEVKENFEEAVAAYARRTVSF